MPCLKSEMNNDGLKVIYFMSNTIFSSGWPTNLSVCQLVADPVGTCQEIDSENHVSGQKNMQMI